MLHYLLVGNWALFSIFYFCKVLMHMKVKSKLEAECKLKSDSIHLQDYTYTWYSASVKEGALFKVSFKMNAWVECHTHYIHTEKFSQTILFYEVNSWLSLSSNKQAVVFPFHWEEQVIFCIKIFLSILVAHDFYLMTYYHQGSSN